MAREEEEAMGPGQMAAGREELEAAAAGLAVPRAVPTVAAG